MTDSPADPPAQPDLATPLDPSPTLSNRQLAANRRNARRSTAVGRNWSPSTSGCSMS